MEATRKRCLIPVCAVMILILAACANQGGIKDGRDASVGIQMDKEAARSTHGLIHLQERPVFPLDDRQRPFAMLLDSRRKASTDEDGPAPIEESRPETRR